MTTHTQACIDSQAETKTKRENYAKEWPNHCTDCEGWGGHSSSYDPSPAGVSLGGGSYQEFDPCETCYCKGKCPRCGALMADGQELFDKDTPCLSCDFTEGTDGMPAVTECGCWYAEEDAYLEALDLYLDEPTTFWIYDDKGCKKYQGDEPLRFAVCLFADVYGEFIEACQVAGLNPLHHNYAIASY